MKKSVNLTKFSFSNNFNFEKNKITDSSNFTDSLISSSSNNYDNNDLNPRNIQINQYHKQLIEYEKNNFNKEKQDQQCHFDYGGKISYNNVSKNQNNEENIYDNKANNLDNINNLHVAKNSSNNNLFKENNINDSKNFNKDDYPEDFLSNVKIEKKCKVFTDAKYIVFENNYGENSCYINVLLHFLFSLKDIYNYLNYLYISNKHEEEKNKNNIIPLTKKEEENNEKMELLTLLGKILYDYNKELENKENKISILKTIEFRECLNEISNGDFPLNVVADPVDLLNYIFEILNEKQKEDMKKNFHLQLNEISSCSPKCNTIRSTRFDKDNFIYHIYIEEVLNYLNKLKIKEKHYSGKLFQISQITSLQDTIKCTKCQKDMNKKICCGNYPNNLIINLVWDQQKIEIDKVFKFFVLLNLEDELNHLFQTPNKKNIRLNYNLTQIILYSSSLSHYITAIFNPIQKVFCLFDDCSIKEYKKLIELFEAVTIKLIKKNEKYYYYPVLLFYSNNDIYEDENILNENKINEESYEILNNKCKSAIEEYRANNILSSQQKLDNYQKLKEKQISMDKRNMNTNINFDKNTMNNTLNNNNLIS